MKLKKYGLELNSLGLAGWSVPPRPSRIAPEQVRRSRIVSHEMKHIRHELGLKWDGMLRRMLRLARKMHEKERKGTKRNEKPIRFNFRVYAGLTVQFPFQMTGSKVARKTVSGIMAHGVSPYVSPADTEIIRLLLTMGRMGISVL